MTSATLPRLPEVERHSRIRTDFGLAALPLHVIGTAGIIGLVAIIASQWWSAKQATDEVRL